MARVVALRAYAKINLGLRVTGCRPDGYHGLHTVFQAVGIADTLTFRSCDGPFTLHCSRDDVPVNERNLVWRAAAGLWALLGRRGALEGVAVTIRKRIPPGAGLGGGSTDAAATLRALSRLWDSRLPPAAIEKLAAEIGADVPFFLCGGTALGLGRGDELYQLADLPPKPIVIAWPQFGVPTAEAFGWFDADAGSGERDPGRRDASEPRPTVWRPDAASLVNDLEPCVIRRRPAIGEMIAQLRESGASAAAMSGSGSAVFGLFPDARRASRAARQLGGRGWTLLATRTLTRRESRGALVSRAPRRIH